jgi:hypothetical protein
MKQNLLRMVVAAAGIVGASSLAAAVAVGCGGDDSEGFAPDASTGDEQRADVQPDVSPPDAGVDTGMDASDGDARPINCDAAPPLLTFPHAANEAFCAHMADCCLVPKEGWDQATCVDLFDQVGGFQYDGLYADSLDAGKVDYDQCKAAACLDDLAHLFCGKFTSADLMAIRRECDEAMKGTVASGGDCVSTIQCQTGLFCRPNGDAGDAGMSGTCVPILGPGQVCKPYGDEACSYRGLTLESSSLYCDTHQGDSGTCKAVLPDDAGCNVDQECRSGVCYGGSITCVSEFVLSDPGVPEGFCAAFTLPDGGTN